MSDTATALRMVVEQRDTERALADDAAVLLDRLNLHDEEWHEAVTQWQARYREARQQND